MMCPRPRHSSVLVLVLPTVIIPLAAPRAAEAQAARADRVIE